MDRFEEALKGLCITDSRSQEARAPLLKNFLQASKALQRALTPINGSVHAAASRATNHEDELTTSIDWVSVYDRVGLLDVEDRDISRLVDAALRHVWRKEEYDFLIGSVGEEGNRIMAETRRAMRLEEGRGGRAQITDCTGERLEISMMTMPGLRPTRCVLLCASPCLCAYHCCPLRGAGRYSGGGRLEPSGESLSFSEPEGFRCVPKLRHCQGWPHGGDGGGRGGGRTSSRQQLTPFGGHPSQPLRSRWLVGGQRD